FQGSGFLAVSGTGWVTGNGFDASVGTWSFTTQNGAADGAFSFSAASAVPDGGYTALLLGLGLLGLCAAYRFGPKFQSVSR
ncbi:MAG TPA: VPDSG-CTERM sorting domain-containing protein, partial [Candidatus Didemnitutus sp.]|nr:VPDSG-CTERM sorting domain-containing protein [Candidatus Didemnitutus sp.]